MGPRQGRLAGDGRERYGDRRIHRALHRRAIRRRGFIAVVAARRLQGEGRVARFFHGRAASSIETRADLLVFALKVVDAEACGRLTFTELDYWIARALARGLLKG